MPKMSEKFRDDDADVVFKSCDGVLFKVHRKRLNTFSEGFAAPDMVKTNEQIPLPETAEVLELLFQYCYPRRGPSLKALSFQTLNDLTESMEKYQIYMGLEPCKERMEDSIPTNPLEVFKYAVKHDYPDVMKQAKAQAIKNTPVEIFRHAVATADRDLVDEAGKRALLKEPTEIFKYAAKNGHVELAENAFVTAFDTRKSRQEMLFGGHRAQIKTEMDLQGALLLITNHIFELMKFATEQSSRGLMNKAAEQSRESPDLSVAARQLDHKTLVAWLHYYNQFTHPERHNKRQRGPKGAVVRTLDILDFSQFWEAERDGNSKPPSSYPKPSREPRESSESEDD